jgi:nicotinamidase/pyrazinamidase
VVSEKFIFWSVDVQRDFMLPDGDLFVKGADALLPNINRLVDAARSGKVFLVSHGCFHVPDDPEFRLFAPHCVQGTRGAEFVPEALTGDFVRVPNVKAQPLPHDLISHQQVILEKPTLDVFDTHHADEVVEKLGNHAEFVVFGVATDYCVRYAANGLLDRGRRVALVEDAIESINPRAGEETIARLRQRGARLVTTEGILAELAASKS